MYDNLEESLESASRQEFREETGVSGVFLEQLYAFGEPGRDPRERVITVAYYALIPSDKLKLRAAIATRLMSSSSARRDKRLMSYLAGITCRTVTRSVCR